MTRSRRLFVLLSFAGALIAVAIASYEVGENRRTETSQGSAQSPETWPSVEAKCAGSQSQLDQCAKRTYKAEQRLLTTVLDDVGAHLGSADERTALDVSQQQWRKYVDGFCAAINGGEGSIAPMLAANCAAVLTRQRIIDVCQWAVPASDLAGIVDPPKTCRPYHT